MINFEMQDIIKSSSSLNTFRNGLDLYKLDRVKDFKFHEGLQRAFAKVEDEELYHVDIAFSERGFETAFCECRDFYEKRGHCKHVAATLIYAKLSGNQAFEKNKLSEVMDYYLNEDFQESQGIEEVRVDYELMFHREEELVGINIKIGTDKTYVVKNMLSFFRDLDRHQSIYFGKKFTLDPYFHRFSEEDQVLMDLLSDIVESHYYHQWENMHDSQGKYLILTPKECLKVLKFMENKTFDLLYRDEPRLFMDCHVSRTPLTCDLALSQEGDIFSLDLRPLKLFKSLDKAYKLFYYDFKLHIFSTSLQKEIRPILDMVHLGYEDLVIPKDQLNDFMVYMYPMINKHMPIQMDESIKEGVEWQDCQAHLYLDLDGDRIVATLKYVYGKHVFDAFKGLESEAYDHIVIRDVKKENHVMHLIEAAAFKVSKEGYYLEEAEDIYIFLREGLKALSQNVTIYYASDFKSFKMIKGSQLSFSSNFSDQGSFFDFSFDLEGLEADEVAAFIKALKEKKRYLRLKDGSFIDLDHERFHAMRDIFNDLHLSDKDVYNQRVALPIYFSMYLDNQLEAFQDVYIKSPQFKDLLGSIQTDQTHSYDLPELGQTQIRSYQEKGFNWLKNLSRYHFGGILADDMGLGKTLQTLMYIHSEKNRLNEIKVLIVAPSSLTYNWLNEVQKFFPDLRAQVIEGTKNQRRKLIEDYGSHDLMISSYALVRNDLECYQDLDLDICVIDEAQHIKNPDSKTAKAMKQLKATHRFALTGTPIENGLSELWSIFDFIMPRYLGTIHQFKNRYGQESVDQRQALKKMIQPFILRRLKQDVLKELPDKIENKMVVELLDDQKKVYLGYLSQFKDDLAKTYATDGFNKSQMKTLAALTRLRQIALDPSLFLDNFEGKSAKLELLQELLEELIAGQHKVLIFSQFTGVLDRIQDRLGLMDLSYFRIDGSTPSRKRHELVETFNKDQTPVFLISLKAGGTGLNLTGADTVIHFDPWWNPAVENQATDRAHRIGQKQSVHVIKLITKGTIEEKIYALQERKKALIEQVIQPGETWINKLTEEEVRDLFS